MKIHKIIELIIKRLSEINLKSKLKLIIFSIMIPMFLLTFLYYGRLMIQLHDDIDRRFKIAEESVQKAFDFYKTQSIVVAKLIGEDETIQKNIFLEKKNAEKHKSLREHLVYMQNMAKVQYTAIYNLRGVVLARGHDPESPKMIQDSENPLFQSAIQGESIYTIEYFQDKTLFFKVAVPIYSKNQKKIIGVTMVGIKNRKDLTPVFASTLQSMSGVDILIVAEKDLITTSFGIQLNNFKMPLTPKTDSIIVNGTQYDLRFISLWPVNYIPDFGVAIALDNSNIRSSMLNTVILMLLSFLAVGLFSYSISSFIAREILKKTKSLMLGTEKILQKDFSYKLPEVGTDELSRLSKTFNLMTVELNQYLKAIGKKNMELTTFNEISKQISYSLEFNKVFDDIVFYLINTYSFEGVALSLVDAARENYKVEILKNFVHVDNLVSIQGDVKPLSIKDGGRIAQCIIEKKEYFFTNVNYEKIQNPVNRRAAENLKIKSALNVPICVGDDVIGAFTLMTYLKSIYLNEEDIESIKRFINQIAVILRNSKLVEELEKKKNQLQDKDRIIQEDLFMAKKIQENILPKDYQGIPGLQFFVHYQPHTDIGGDLFDIFKMSNGDIRIFISDATGHGIQASLTTMLIKSEYEKIKHFDLSVNSIIKSLNNAVIHQYYHLNLFFNCMILDINMKEKNIYYSSAGHPDQFFLTKGKTQKLPAGGKLIGLLEGVQYEKKIVPFNHGDKILLFTDGLIEEFNPSGEEFGEDGLKKVLESNINADIDTLGNQILRELRSFTSSHNDFSDDITIIGIEINLNMSV